jgi:hypothetical protein
MGKDAISFALIIGRTKQADNNMHNELMISWIESIIY